MTPIPSVLYFYIKDFRFKPLKFLVDKLSCSHCVPFWVTLIMNFNESNLLLTIFINILVVKLAIKYTG